ncbi:hypothetical protein OG864_53010 [Streptomyces sp. NBC_00124]|nr:DddA-like double-stranded DNA deaminase toxin [Streptomyces sp. NBC_00124]MCX5367371.1 hypothetical protein [Streptomyces sp. NBC_00124]
MGSAASFAATLTAAAVLSGGFGEGPGGGNLGGVGLTRTQGLAAAKEAKNSFEQPGGTNGALYVEGYDSPIPISSGHANRHEGYEDPPGVGRVNREHAETHAAALMRKKGWSNAHLFIDQDYICGACMQSLNRMVPPKGTLHVTYRNSAGEIKTVPFGAKP